MKKCSKCKQEKSKNEFNKYKYSLDGLLYYCKDCHKKISQEFRDKLRFKVCSKCKQEKHIKYFYKCTTTEDKLFNECKDCCITNTPTSAIYRKKRDAKHYTKYWQAQVGLPHAKNSGVHS